MPRAAGLRARGRPPARSGVLVLDRVRNLITQDEYFPDLKVLLYLAPHSELRTWHEFCVDCSVRCPGSSIPLLSPVRCGCLRQIYLHGLGCKDCFSLTSPSDTTQKTPEDADVCRLQEENKQLTWVFYSFLIRKTPFASRRKILN